ncbi:TonB-dependent receptor [Geothrix sp. PMB-07]|uniref:TonB-dependent receptor n=1 Tax=Geothrix sp. PMB-07 TaxID=3068640 RepID=UPI002741ADEE|nr:TonB-dependent receptor [Geothrix sp. PMB-07]WLT30914.1 TonB-dependent receptor [Geothrix sp. PMB-07]
MNTKRFLSGLAMLLAGGASLSAQVMSGAISGTVVDEQNRPISGVTIRISSSTLIASRTVVSDSKGQYRIPLLPPGNYSLVFNRTDYLTIGATNLRIGQDSTLVQNITLKKIPEAQALVAVEGTAPGVIAKSETTTGTSIGSDRLIALPTGNRDYGGVADMSVGIVSGRGGGYSVRGGTTNSTNFRKNGVDVVDPVSNSVSLTTVVPDNIEDLQVVLSPLHPRNGRALGGSINVTTKSGGNTFTGSVRSSLWSSAWSARNVNEQFGSVENLNRNYQVVIGGPIIKDMLWFNVASIFKPLDRFPGTVPDQGLNLNTYSRPARSTIPVLDQWILAGPGNGFYWAGDPRSGGITQGAPYVGTADQRYLEYKLTYSPHADHTVEVNVTDDRESFTNTVGRPNYVLALRQLGDQMDTWKARGINYRGFFGSNTSLQVTYESQNSVIAWPLGDTGGGGTGEAVYMVFDKPAGPLISYQRYATMGTGYNPIPEERGSSNGRIELKRIFEFSGTHDVDLGIDYYRARRFTGDQGGGRNLLVNSVGGGFRNPVTGEWLFAAVNWQGAKGYGQSNSGNSGIAPVIFQWVGKDGVSTNQNSAIYLADQWTISPKLNLFLSWRHDMFKVIDTDGAQLARSSAPSPRIQIRWDVKGDSLHLLDMSFARFNSDINIGFTDFFIKKANALSVLRGWNKQSVGLPGLSGDPSLLNQAAAWVPTSALVDPSNYGPAYSVSDNSRQNQIRGTLTAPYVYQLELGYRRSFDDRSWFRLGLVYRDYRNFWAIDHDLNDTNYIDLPNPLNPAGPASRQVQTYIYNTDIFKRVYHGIEVEWEKRLNSVLTFQGNYGWSRLVGNNDGGDSSGGTYMDNSAQGLLYNRSIKRDMGLTPQDYSPTGPLLNNVEHRARLVLLAIQPMGIGRITYALALKYNSGSNWSAAAAAPYDWSKATFTPAVATTNEKTYTQYWSDRGAYRENDYYRLDLKISWEVPISIKTTRFIGDLMVDNVTNRQVRYGYYHGFNNGDNGNSTLWLSDTRFGSAPKAQGSYFYDSPRSLSFSIGLKF